MWQIFSQIDISGLPKGQGNEGDIENILNIVFAIVASITLLMVVISGMKYTLAGGDPNSTSQAKKSLTYSLVGLVVVISAYAIVKVIIGVTK